MISLVLDWSWTAIESLYVLWILYGFIMNLKRQKDSAEGLSKPAYYLAMPAFVTGYALDVALNLTVMTVVLMEAPKWGEWTISARLSRHYKEGSGFNRDLAVWMEKHLLGYLDPRGKHIS